MNILIILGHPDPGSLNHAIAHAVRDDLAAAGHDIIFHDLYGEGFDPLLTAGEIPKSGTISQTIAAHCQELSRAEGIIIVEEAKDLCRTAFRQDARRLAWKSGAKPASPLSDA